MHMDVDEHWYRGNQDTTHDEPVSKMTLYEIAGVPTAIEP